MQKSANCHQVGNITYVLDWGKRKRSYEAERVKYRLASTSSLPDTFPFRDCGGNGSGGSIHALLLAIADEFSITYDVAGLLLAALGRSTVPGDSLGKLPIVSVGKRRDIAIFLRSLQGVSPDWHQPFPSSPEELECQMLEEGVPTYLTGRATLRPAIELASMLQVTAYQSIVILVGGKPHPAEKALRFYPANGHALNVVDPSLGEDLYRAERFAMTHRNLILAIVDRAISFWEREPFEGLNSDTHGFVRWLWCVAMAMSLDESQLDSLSETMRDRFRYLDQTGDLLVRL